MGIPTHIIDNALLRDYDKVKDNDGEEDANFGQMMIIATHELLVDQIYNLLMEKFTSKLECYYEIRAYDNPKAGMPMVASDDKPIIWIAWDSSEIHEDLCSKLENAINSYNSWGESEVYLYTFEL
ncbi:hypothetical protein GGI13_003889 [Coemansia sp. RSA 455]|nr:hypothetical protein LPJ71_001457 [Coemansia sp. S17]KAJ2052844.1 hypothetical protein GGI08_004935 [Coemansia sp. S2]KAJ2100109.1 hypothetical protein GGI09_002438 [Coemansia sp. S100]KAJ2107161.1 hypothetical protein GGI16_001644 [Coemansia sp. S142-1]KAJ2114822.1 hypothetical protein IW146_002786 [Coemansia sp. RSA 922]KAJ2251355.1 hypothetical protein GGI13_003889 [Coemansia sp. RSA 455]KAJ2466192.1 hypothetical protein GGI03_002245 [Coemansia sp. RSA 2337]